MGEAVFVFLLRDGKWSSWAGSLWRSGNLGLSVKRMPEWTPFRYVSFDAPNGASTLFCKLFFLTEINIYGFSLDLESKLFMGDGSRSMLYYYLQKSTLFT